ncbi:MAG: pyridoxamine 5'-phosphate oxidase family protein [Candidatus Thorarchaeota archaeon SMTZ1-45]
MKEYPKQISLQEVWVHFEGFPLAHLATVEGNQPRVRPMSLISIENRLWLATKTEWDKVGQIIANNKVEFTVAPLSKNGTGSIRATAIAVVIKDRETKQRLSLAIPWFNQYWIDSDDPNFTLIKLEPTRMLYDHPSDRRKYTVILT